LVAAEFNKRHRHIDGSEVTANAFEKKMSTQFDSTRTKFALNCEGANLSGLHEHTSQSEVDKLILVMRKIMSKETSDKEEMTLKKQDQNRQMLCHEDESVNKWKTLHASIPQELSTCPSSTISSQVIEACNVFYLFTDSSSWQSICLFWSCIFKVISSLSDGSLLMILSITKISLSTSDWDMCSCRPDKFAPSQFRANLVLVESN
jgi:hypothetical protein